ncbi:MAG: TIGR00725 family protein [Anaerolineae bacterium]|nr:TIGR00725 family protein [Anaerolineae bacterium]
MNEQVFVAVIGSASTDAEYAALAEEVGREIARRGAILVCGGRGGVMEAACRGAKSAGGTTVGILPGTDRREANAYVDIPIVTGMGEARNAIVVRTADAVIAVSGGYGTLSEVGLALKMGRPVVGLRTWELNREGRPAGGILEASTPAGAVRLALERRKPA